jgi:acetyl-CoA carboxylase biotin carboxylase subunit
MFRKVLVANRGEIALRVIRACRMLDLKTVAVHSKADAEALHVRFADEAVCVGPAPAAQSYLNIPRLIAAAEITGADAISGVWLGRERGVCAADCQESNLVFIRPRADPQMGDKAEARRLMSEAGVPVVPGSPGAIDDERKARASAEEIGFPVLVKAAAGGGGKGMRIARDADEFARAFPQARREAEAAFADGRLYIEKFLERPRHIEVQILGDKQGNVIHLGERDCSLQRRHQKLLEEAPSPVITDAWGADGRSRRPRGGEDRLSGAGTIEFLLCGERGVLLHGDEHPHPGRAPPSPSW